MTTHDPHATRPPPTRRLSTAPHLDQRRSFKTTFMAACRGLPSIGSPRGPISVTT
jgi:hypothetical protein